MPLTGHRKIDGGERVVELNYIPSWGASQVTMGKTAIHAPGRDKHTPNTGKTGKVASGRLRGAGEGVAERQINSARLSASRGDALQGGAEATNLTEIQQATQQGSNALVLGIHVEI